MGGGDVKACLSLAEIRLGRGEITDAIKMLELARERALGNRNLHELRAVQKASEDAQPLATTHKDAQASERLLYAVRQNIAMYEHHAGTSAAPGPRAATGSTSVSRPKRRSSRAGTVGLTVVGFVSVVIIVGAAVGHRHHSSTDPGTAATSGQTTPGVPKDEADARNYILAHAADAYRVRANVKNVEDDIGAAAQDATQSNIDQLAIEAQTAHDDIDEIRADFTTSDLSGALGDAELNAFSGANDLKNAMGAIVTWTGDPNPATLASMTSQLSHARSEWNRGVTTIWHTARRPSPPTV